MIFKFKNNSIDLSKRTYIMGILNVTSDSFSDGGKYLDVDLAVKRASQMIEEGADFIDVGGESTRPGYEPISIDEELERTIPVIERIKKNFDIPISIDTYKPAVAKAAISANVDIVNDIWGLQYDVDMANICANSDVGIIAMANRDGIVDSDICDEVSHTFKKSLDIAKKANICNERIVFDAGFGFGKTYEQNIYLLNNLEKVDAFGRPMLVGISRKSMIGITLDADVHERIEGTIVCNTIAISKGANIIRVHDVKEAKRTAIMIDKILRS